MQEAQSLYVLHTFMLAAGHDSTSQTIVVTMGAVDPRAHWSFSVLYTQSMSWRHESQPADDRSLHLLSIWQVEPGPHLLTQTSLRHTERSELGEHPEHIMHLRQLNGAFCLFESMPPSMLAIERDS